MKKLTLFTLLVLLVSGCSSVNTGETPADTLEAQAQQRIFPDQEWKDSSGNRINAHSGSTHFENGFYYWYGVHKIDGRDERSGRTAAGVHVYRSTDLINWDDFGITLPTSRDPKNDLYRARMERPKVVYNESTDKYVMFFKLYDTKSQAYVGVATADEPTGPFTYRNRFLGSSDRGTGGFTVFQYPNGDLYHIAVRRGDRRLVMAKMRDDYRYPATKYVEMPGIKPSTEGVDVFLKDGTFHLTGSGSSGWKPNPARYYTSRSLRGPWTRQDNPLRGFNPISKLGPDKSFGAQPGFVNKVQGRDNV